MKAKTAEPLTLRSDDRRLYMLAYSAGWNAAADGGDLGERASKLGLEGSAAFREGAAAYEEQVVSAARAIVPSAPMRVTTLHQQFGGSAA
ncbi:hypothetical protein ACIRD6_35490 [Streptomyces sp. NPDC102473]|uniref:hypothetical protein n=1 Tax=Streptomyces sp. NPDC102473 TaxID=3366180 RepID=UPI0037FB661B